MDGDKKFPPTEFRFGLKVRKFTPPTYRADFLIGDAQQVFQTVTNRYDYSQIISLWGSDQMVELVIQS